LIHVGAEILGGQQEGWGSVLKIMWNGR